MVKAPPEERSWVGSRWFIAAVALVLLFLMFGRAMMRRFDMDEHQFVAPGVFLAHDGLLPYQDYPYFHMPLLVYIHGALAAILPHKLLAARTLSVVCGWLIVVLLWRVGWQALAGLAVRTRWLLVGGVLSAFLCSQLFTYTNGWGWNHDSATLCALGAFLLEIRGLKKGRVGLIALAGVLAGLSLGIRLSFALIVLPMGVWLFIGQSPLTWRRRGFAFVLAMCGALLVLLPAFLSWAHDPEAFVFGNLGFADVSTQAYRRNHEGFHSLGGKAYYLVRKFFEDPGNAFLLVIAAYGLGYSYWKRRAWRGLFANEMGLLWGFLPMLLIGAWGPSPVQQQYYYMLLPFLVLAGFYALALECSEPMALKRWRKVIIWAALLPAVIGFPRWYWTALYLPFPEYWIPMRVANIGQWIKSQCPPHTRVLTADPLFPLEGGLDAYQEYATGRFILQVSDLIGPEEHRRYHMTWGAELDRVLRERPPGAIFWHTKGPSLLTQYARQNGFRKMENQFSNIEITPGMEPECFELWIREP
jgi:hypothetical protein